MRRQENNYLNDCVSFSTGSFLSQNQAGIEILSSAFDEINEELRETSARMMGRYLPK